MSVKYIGRVTSYSGKNLFDILCRLKGYGTGRIVYRNVFNERYAEPSYYVITRVEHDPTLKKTDQFVNGKVYGMKVFRGEDKGERAIKSTYKADWRLVPRIEEEQFLNYDRTERPRVKVAKYAPLPPLLKVFTEMEMKAKGQSVEEMPQLKININRKANNRAIYKEE